MEFNLAQIFAAVAAANPDRDCIVFGDRRLSFAQTDERARRFARALHGWGLGAHRERSQLAPHESGQSHLGLYMAIATAATVFIISLAYNQVIELFPTGGGGYRVATSLIGPRAGLVSGAALIVDYVLTIAISVASGVDALFSLLPAAAGQLKLGTEVVLVVVLLVMNMRGMKESIRFLLPIFIGFVLTHTVLIGYGVIAHGDRLPAMGGN